MINIGEFEMRIQQTPKGQYYVTIPLSMIKAKKWQKGQEVVVTLNGKGNVELIEIEG